MEEEEQQFVKTMSSLYGDEAFADLTITCQGQTWRVHRSVVCPQSDFFNVACRSEFKEAKERLIDLPEDEKEMIDLLIYFFYHQHYGPSRRDHLAMMVSKGSKSEEFCGWVMKHGKMFALACKYGIPLLKNFTVERFRYSYYVNACASVEFQAAVVQAIRNAYQYAELPRENAFLAVLFCQREIIPANFPEFLELLEESHVIAAEAAKLAMRMLDFNNMEVPEYLQLLRKLLQGREWKCYHCHDEERSTVPDVLLKHETIQMICGICRKTITELTMGSGL